MSTKNTLSIFLFLILFSTSLMSCSKDEIPEENLPLVMLKEVNKIRREGCICGGEAISPVPELSWNDTLATAALFHAKDMVHNNYFSHNSPDGTFPITRAKAAGYSGNYVSENIARGYSSVSMVIQAWLDSESHCKTLMDSTFEEMGAARYQNYWVQEFGRH